MSDEMEAKQKAKLLQYERKLATLTAMNSALQSENNQLRSQSTQGPEDLQEELDELQDEFERRLGQADKSIAELRDDRDKLRAQLKASSQSGSAAAGLLQEKATTLTALKSKGDELTRRNGALEATIRQLTQRNEEAVAERDRCDSRCTALESQLASMQERATSAADKASLQIEGLEAQVLQVQQQARKQVAQAQQGAAQQTRDLALQKSIGEAQAAEQTDNQQQALVQQVTQLQASLSAAQRDANKQDADHCLTIAHLKHQLADLESQKDDADVRLSNATKPLIRQIEVLVREAAIARDTLTSTDEQMHARCAALEAAAMEADEQERTTRNRLQACEGMLRTSKLAAAEHLASCSVMAGQLETDKHRIETLLAEKVSLEERLATSLAHSVTARQDHEGIVRDLEERLWDCDSKARAAMLERDELSASLQRSQQVSMKEDTAAVATADSADSSARMQVIRGSGHESHSSGDFDGLFYRTPGAGLNGVGSNPLKHTGTIESAALQQVTAQLATAECARDEMARQLQEAFQDNAALRKDTCRLTHVTSELKQVQARLELAMEVIGQRNVVISELEEDVADMKRIFHKQLEETVDQLEAARLDAAQSTTPSKIDS